MEVPSTQTSADRNQEKKKHADEMAILNSQKEIATRDTKLVIEAADKASERLSEIAEKLEHTIMVVDTASRETSQFIAHCEAIMRETGSKVAEMVQMANKIEQRAAQAAKMLDNAEKESLIVHDNVVGELELLQIQRTDLDIYHYRLAEYFKKHLPDQEIKI